MQTRRFANRQVRAISKKPCRESGMTSRPQEANNLKTWRSFCVDIEGVRKLLKSWGSWVAGIAKSRAWALEVLRRSARTLAIGEPWHQCTGAIGASWRSVSDRRRGVGRGKRGRSRSARQRSYGSDGEASKRRPVIDGPSPRRSTTRTQSGRWAGAPLPGPVEGSAGGVATLASRVLVRRAVRASCRCSVRRLRGQDGET